MKNAVRSGDKLFARGCGGLSGTSPVCSSFARPVSGNSLALVCGFGDKTQSAAVAASCAASESQAGARAGSEGRDMMSCVEGPLMESEAVGDGAEEA